MWGEIAGWSLGTIGFFFGAYKLGRYSSKHAFTQTEKEMTEVLYDLKNLNQKEDKELIKQLETNLEESRIIYQKLFGEK